MPLSKERNRERMKKLRVVQPKSGVVQPKSLPDYLQHPNRYLLAHMKAYPGGFNEDGSYRGDYDEELDTYINPMVRQAQPNVKLS